MRIEGSLEIVGGGDRMLVVTGGDQIAPFGVALGGDGASSLEKEHVIGHKSMVRWARPGPLWFSNRTDRTQQGRLIGFESYKSSKSVNLVLLPVSSLSLSST